MFTGMERDVKITESFMMLSLRFFMNVSIK